MLMFLIVSILGGVLVAGFVVPAAGVVAQTANATAEAMQDLPMDLEVGPPAQGSTVLMADGQTLATFYNQNRKNVPLDQIAPIMRKAQIGIEDQRFYEHGALDFRGTLRALVRSSSGSAQGGSTLTQQYVKLALLYNAQARNDTAGIEAANSRTVTRKILELRYAIALEKKYSKDQILENYLNMAYFGDGAYGIETAAQHYFGIPASQLSLSQAAMMAGIVRNPVTTNPIANPAAAKERMNNVLDRLAELNIVTAQEAKDAKNYTYDKSKAKPNPSRGCSVSKYPHLCDYVYRTLLTLPSLGADRTTRLATLNTNNLTIQTEIDPRFQDVAQQAVSGFIAPTDPVIGTFTMVQPGTGLIKAMAQSRPELGAKPGQTYFNYAAPIALGGSGGFTGGSTFKAYTITAALLKNAANPGTFDPINHRIQSPPFYTFTDAMKWQGCSGPFSASHTFNNNGLDGNYNMYDGATMSSNTFFTQLEYQVGICDVVKAAEALGIKRADGANMETGALPDGKSITAQGQPADGSNPLFTLGNTDIPPLYQASAYAALAARGKACDPIILKEIKDGTGKAYSVPSANCRQAIPEEVADRVADILHGPFSYWGTAESAMIPGMLVSGKTGTQSDETILTNGFTPDLQGVANLTVDKKAAPAIAARKANVVNGQAQWTLKTLVVHGTNMPAGGYPLRGSSGRETGAQMWKPAMQAALSLIPNKTPFVAPPNSPYAGAQTNSDISFMQCSGKVTMSGVPQIEKGECYSKGKPEDLPEAPVPGVTGTPSTPSPSASPSGSTSPSASESPSPSGSKAPSKSPSPSPTTTR